MISLHDLAQQISRSIPESEAHVVVHHYHLVHCILDLLVILVILMAAVAEILEVFIVSDHEQLYLPPTSMAFT